MADCARTVREHNGSATATSAAASNVLQSIIVIPERRLAAAA